MPPAGGFAVRGTAIDSPVLGEVRVRQNALILVDGSGSIGAVVESGEPGYAGQLEAAAAAGTLVECGDGQYILPGLIDLHIHAPQWPQLGKALDVPLSEWLLDHTFPLEARYEDIAFAGSVYPSLVRALLANGTTTAVYFATRHLPATKLLADTCLGLGQRAVVGRVAMDDVTTCPDFYRDHSAALAIAETEELIGYIRGLGGNQDHLVMPAVTPRFIPSCSDELMLGLGELVVATDAHVQTHCSESDWAHGFGLDRFGQSDTNTYHDMGLLTRRTVLAHSNFIDEQDLEIIAGVGAAVAHCPLSNVYFANAVFPLRESLDRGVHVGLGTDISGGPSASMFNAARSAVAASRVREDGVDNRIAGADRGVAAARVTSAEAFWAATTGGGIALDLPVGLLAPGYSFDALLIDTTLPESEVRIWPDLDHSSQILEKIVHNAGRGSISSVWVNGELVSSR
jgi:guanine deaminase